ncbi:MAG TPA: hypothetical protein PKO15_18295, partial [Fibrobacteria bacterium]|nr:hypothetical protein [Fibrobacteria bacterium]
VVGWRSAGLELPDAEKTGGVHRITHIGSTLFAMDAYSEDSGLSGKKFRWRMWQGRVGSTQWSQLPMPGGEIPNRWVVIGDELFVGAKFSPNVYAYRPSAFTWRRLDLAPGKSDGGQWSVDLLAAWKGRLVVGVLDGMSNNHYSWVGSGDRQNPSWVLPRGIRGTVPPDQALDIGGTLYGIRPQMGIFRFRESDSTWEALPSARGKTDPQEDEGVSAIGEFEGKLVVGYEGFWDGLFRWEGANWISMTPTPGGGETRRETPKSIYAITTYQGQLFMGGLGGGDPLVRGSSDTGAVRFGSWKIFDANWCKIMGRCPPEIRSIMGVGDTLYATAWTFVGKIPLNQIEASSRPVFTN